MWAHHGRRRARERGMRRHSIVAERISTVILAVCLMEAWCWAVPTVVDDIGAGGQRSDTGADNRAPVVALQLSSLAQHYERSTTNFKRGTCDTLPAREQSLSRAVQYRCVRDGDDSGKPHSGNDTITAQHQASARLDAQAGRFSGSPVTTCHHNAPGQSRSAHCSERRRRLYKTGKKRISRGLSLALLFLLVARAVRCKHSSLTLLQPMALVALLLLQLPVSAATAVPSVGDPNAVAGAAWQSLVPELLASQASALGVLAVLLPLYLIYSAIAARYYPPRMHVLWPALSGKFKLDEFGPVECLRQAQRKHGEIFRICLPGQPCTFLIGPEACQCWFKQPNDTFDPAAAYRSFMKPVFGPRVVYDAEEGKMSSQLRFVKHGLGIEMMKQHPAKLVREVREYCIAEQKGWLDRGVVELYHMTSEMIINTASRCILGDEIRDTVHKEFAKYYSDLEKGISHLSFFASWLPTAAHRKRDVARKKLSEIFTPIIRARRLSSAAIDPAKKNKDFLQVLIDGEYRDGTKPDDEAVVGLLVAALFGGQHTSNITSTWVLMMIHSPKNRESLLPRLLKEQEEVLGRHGGEVTFDALQDMTLLENCIKETLRIFPPLIALMRKAVKAVEYTATDGKTYTIPRGDLVCISAAVQNKLPELFDDPDTFNPDRHGGDSSTWVKEGRTPETTFRELQSGPAKRELVDLSASWIPFGGGRHACVGRYFAFLQMKTIVSTLIRHYDMEWQDPDWQPKVDYSQIVATPPLSPVTITRRAKPVGGAMF